MTPQLLRGEAASVWKNTQQQEAVAQQQGFSRLTQEAAVDLSALDTKYANVPLWSTLKREVDSLLNSRIGLRKNNRGRTYRPENLETFKLRDREFRFTGFGVGHIDNAVVKGFIEGRTLPRDLDKKDLSSDLMRYLTASVDAAGFVAVPFGFTSVDRSSSIRGVVGGRTFTPTAVTVVLPMSEQDF